MQKMQGKIRLKDIAAALNISTATVSLCLNERQSRYQVNADTVAKVRAFAAKVGYVPDRNARNLKRGIRRCVGLLTNRHWRAGQKCLPAVFAAEQQLSSCGIECRQLSARNHLEGLSQLRELGCSEVIVFEPVIEDPAVGSVSWQPDDLVQRFPGLKIYSVDYSVNNQLPPPDKSGLIKRFGVKVWDFQQQLVQIMQKYYPGEIMLHSWRCSQLLARELRQRNPELIFEVDAENPFKIGIAGAQKYLRLRNKYNIRNVFWGDDRMACGFINELLKYGVSVPGEVNVISFDNLEFAQYLTIPLTTWGVPILRHTQAVVDSIINQSELSDTISLPVLSPGGSAALTPAMLDELQKYCHISSEEDVI